MERRPFLLSRWWVQGALLTFLFGFTVLGILAAIVYIEQPPIPAKVVTDDGRLLYTEQDVFEGMGVFQRYGLMQYGSVYGHGAYLGPDFTAAYLRLAALEMIAGQKERGLPPEQAQAVVASELRTNTYDPETGILTLGPDRASAHDVLVAHYQEVFGRERTEGGLQAKLIPTGREVERLVAFFGWTAWTATAQRPGTDHSYTNNWPPEPLVGNVLTGQALTWSAVSIIGLLGGMGLILFFFGRYDWLGWGKRSWPLQFRPVQEVALTPAQRVLVWFLLVGAVLFLLQTLMGGLLAHYRSEPDGFYGFDVSKFFPYNLARTWHLQLSIFWVSLSFLATGIFLAPLVAGEEPRGQARLSLLLLGLLVVVVGGTLIGTFLSITGRMGDSTWYWLGDQGWEYLDLGRLWQILLVVGLAFWVAILVRGLRPALRREAQGNLPWLFFYSALAIPAFYAVGLLATRDQGFVVIDFWRFWVVHLWVEDFLELFTTVMVATIFVLLGMVREKTAVRVIYLDIILYSAGGVVGSMHHLYFSGSPSIHMALGATFSALEVIPLLLLTLEAWAFMRSGESSLAERGHPHKWAVMFLIAVGFWNFLGAGIFGFLINLPVVSFYQIGTGLTANHAHTSMMGVYGMLAIGLLLFCLRYQTHPDRWTDRPAKISFWSLNVGLAWMSTVNLFPVGLVQLYHSVSVGYYEARSIDFLQSPLINTLEWLRLPGDALFIVGGVLPLFWVCVRGILHPNPGRIAIGETELHRHFTQPVPASMPQAPSTDLPPE